MNLITKIIVKIRFEAKNIKKKIAFFNNTYVVSKFRQPIVKSIDETIDHIIENRCSVSRFGDGEFLVMYGENAGFQQANTILAKCMRDVLESDLDNFIICIPDIFGDLSMLVPSSIEFNKMFLGKMRYKLLKILPSNKVFYNSFFTRCYNMFVDKTPCERWFNKNKQIFRGTDILLVEGEKSRLGVGNDLFAAAKSIERILCPAENAWDKYTEIYETTLKHGKEKLILIALGMTATVLAYDLAKSGLWAIDIGHIDIEYEWFLRGSTEKILIPNKYVNEVEGGAKVDECTDALYLKSIICKIV